MLPYTPRSGLKAFNFKEIASVPKSPACQISSHCSKCLKTASSRKLWVSEISPMRVKLINFVCFKNTEKRRVELICNGV